MTGGRTALVVGASRALGLAIAGELVDRDWRVIGTVRGTTSAGLQELADRAPGRLEVGQLDMTDPATMSALRRRLDGRTVDLLFVNGGITNDDVPAAEVDAETFGLVMLTNALGPMRVIAALQDLVPPTGTIAVMSSRQGSIAANTRGGFDVYRASKSALNQLMRSDVARHPGDPRTMLLMHPGHVQTDLGGADAPLTVDESARGVVDTVLAQQGEGGLQFLSHTGETLPW